MKLPKTYEANQYETEVYKLWEASGAFQPSEHGDPWSIVMPPPNATGKLHVGHAEGLAIQDTLVRYHRMRGKSVLWVPGTDHAAIATNAILEKQLAAEGKTKHDIGREAFLKRLHAFVDESKDTIRSQIRAMGASCDWSRERYTMDPQLNRVVGEVFIKMYEDGLIYRGHRIVNWDPAAETTVSDDELEHLDETTTLFTFKYGPFEIATARPETKFGDKYVVVHPKDKRYAKFKHGDTFEAEWINGKVTATVIKDEVIDREFGTGAMTITPWHDPTDFDIAERHNLDKEQIIGFDGKLLEGAGEFAGLTIEEARPKIVAKLRDKGLVVAEDPGYEHRVAVNYRGKGVVEPQIKEQWFIDVNKPAVEWKGRQRSLKEVMQLVIKDSDIEILPERFKKTYFHWIDNLRDWCISRQIWWGHRIPVWYKGGQVAAGFYPPEEQGWEQDPDTLDTWFSSALWTWSTLLDPEAAVDPSLDFAEILKASPDFHRFHPTTLMETGYDILFFWVARMILMTTYATGQIPFEKVYLHGLVRLKNGKKMSKSDPEGNIDPLDVIEEFGTDAVRLSLVYGQSPGNDLRVYKEKIASLRNFCNKLWNIARYVEDKVGDDSERGAPKPESSADHWILSRLDATATEVAELLDQYELGRAYDTLYHFIWDDFADWYVEASKVQFNPGVLAHVLEVTLKITHPFAPFVTETIWDTLKWEDGLLISSEWPKTKPGDHKEAEGFTQLQGLVGEIRQLRAELGLTQNQLYYTENPFLEKNAELVQQLSRVTGVAQVIAGKGLHLTQTTYDAWLDVEEEKALEYAAKLNQRRDELQAQVERLEGRLANQDYVDHAPKALVEETQTQRAETQTELEKLEGVIEKLRTN